MREIVLVAHNVRSTHNVGSLLRTAEGLGVKRVCLTGYTPFPRSKHDLRLPHLANKIDKQIAKTALGAEKLIEWQYSESIKNIITELKENGYEICALEQAKGSVKVSSYKAPKKVAIIVGREVEGIEPEVVELCDLVIEIPMFGKKESYNVVQAAAMALYHCRFV
jgi:23S rRNA (guanosine2251-2'-O)-methyltransferase